MGKTLINDHEATCSIAGSSFMSSNIVSMKSKKVSYNVSSHLLALVRYAHV